MSELATITNPLDSEDALRKYCDFARHELKDHIAARIAFLETAKRDLEALYSLSSRTGNEKLSADLSDWIGRASGELALLSGLPLDSSSAVVAVPLSAPLGEPAPGSSNGHPPASSPSPAAPGNGVAPPAPAPEPKYQTIDLTAYNESRALARTAPFRAAPPIPKLPQRTLEEVYTDTETLTELAEAEGDQFKGKTGLIRLKALLCKQRSLQAELAARDIQHWPLRQLMNYLRRRIDEEHGAGHYLIPLRAELHPSDAWPWTRLADLYELLAEAHEALDWYESEASKLNQPERQELLESVAAHQTRLWRFLQAYFPRQNDEHQISFFRDLCGIAEEEDVYLFSLQERCPDEVLDEKAEQLPIVLEHLRLDKKNRAKREAALQELRLLVGQPDFGTGDKDAELLSKAVVKCRVAGAPASSVALRSILLDWAALLEESSVKAVQEVAKALQAEVDRRARQAEPAPADNEPLLSETERLQLEAVRNLVRGKRCLFIGGICREESRQRLEKELGLAELVWPSTNGTESVYKFESDIQNTDITVILIRFMRTGWGQARELAVKHDKMFVRLPAGYGLHQVVHQFGRQLIHEEATAVAV
jgi:hypothetical protein